MKKIVTLAAVAALATLAACSKGPEAADTAATDAATAAATDAATADVGGKSEVGNAEQVK